MRLIRADADTNWVAVRELLREGFAYMAERPSQPARAATATADDLAAEATQGSVSLTLDANRPIAGLFTRPPRDHPKALYLGKLAVAKTHQGRGLAYRLVEHAAPQARARK